MQLLPTDLESVWAWATEKTISVVTCEGDKTRLLKICANHRLPFATHEKQLSSHLPLTFTNLSIIVMQNNWPTGKGIAAITLNILDGCTKGTKWHSNAANSKTQRATNWEGANSRPDPFVWPPHCGLHFKWAHQMSPSPFLLEKSDIGAVRHGALLLLQSQISASGTAHFERRSNWLHSIAVALKQFV